MRIGSFEFNRRELAGSMGDFGTLFPLAVGYMAVCGMDPAGFLVMIGLVNIVTGCVYRLPMPVEPQKVIAVVAIAQRWSPSLILATGFGTGIVWLIFGLTGWIQKVADHTPKAVIRGIQIALGVMLGWEGGKMLLGWGPWATVVAPFGGPLIYVGLGLLALIVIATLRESRQAPAALVLMLLGGTAGWFQGGLADIVQLEFRLPSFTPFSLEEVGRGMLLAGVAQLPLTATNAILATSALIKEYWPDRPVTERSLAVNMGLMNTTTTWLGGMPLCTGSGGLAGQYYYGARTGGANILEGTIEIGLGLFLAPAIAGFFAAFPMSIVGAMMLMVGLHLARYTLTLRAKDLLPAGVTVGVALATNMAVGFCAGIAVYYSVKYYFRLTGRCRGGASLFRLTPASRL